MNGVHLNGKARGYEKAVSGCLGRMVNLFDLTSGVSGNRLLTNKPHNHGPLSRSRSDVSRVSNIAGDEMEDKMMASDLRTSSIKESDGTPVKMLMAQEMSKDRDLRESSPNVVAKLMGLDALPKQPLDIASQTSHLKGHSLKSHSDIPIGYWKEENSVFDENFDHKMHSHEDQPEYKDIHEILQQSRRTISARDKSPQKGRFDEIIKDKRLALIRQKFMEAKRLAIDEKLRQTKEFQDALDVLSSDGDLFLKVLQEPISLISQPLCGGQSIPVSPETKRITVLRPSKIVTDYKCSTKPAGRDEKQVKKVFQVNQVNLWDNHPKGFAPTISTWKVNDSPTQPTRIVVLKPSPAKANGFKTIVPPMPSSLRAPGRENFAGKPEDEEAREAREVAKEITQQMRENLSGHRRDETLLSSVFSNGYTGKASSFEKSDHEFVDDGNLSDSEVVSPTSRNSWDYVNRFGGPYSISSFSRASYSPESSVCREAKKRLSERWAMMASVKNNIEQRQFQRSSSTLGEMLALSEIKKPERCEQYFEYKPQDPRASTSCLNHSVSAGETGDDLPRNLSRSKSVPVSSTAHGHRLNIDVSDSNVSKVDIPNEIAKARSSFTGRVTSLFFSKTRKPRKEKSSTSCEDSNLATASPPGLPGFPGRICNDRSEFVLPPSQSQDGSVFMDLNGKSFGQGFHQGALSVSQPCVPGIQGENLDQPSPLSVLEQSFEDDEGAMTSRLRNIDLHAGKSLSQCLSKSNLIEKSPPIESIARTLSWDESCTETDPTYPLNFPFVSPGAEDDEGEWLHLVQCLLAMGGLDGEGYLGSKFSRWYTPESPLDPLLRDKFIDLNTTEPLHEAKRRQLRSRKMFVFDCVDAALINITGFRTPASQWATLHLGPNGRFSEADSMAEKVLVWMKECFSNDVKCLASDYEDNSLVEWMVIMEVVGKGWKEQAEFEVDIIGKEIEGKLMEELVEEYVIEWTSSD